MKDKFNKKYIIITKDLQKNLIEFLDEIQFDIAGDDDKESMHKVNFISWAINELLNSYEAYFPKDSKKKRDDYVEETFLDWNLPEMSDEEFQKLVDNFDNFLRAWEKEYLKDNPKKKDTFKPRLDDVAEHCSLEEIKDMLIELKTQYTELIQNKEDMSLFAFIKSKIDTIINPLIIEFINNLDTNFYEENIEEEEDDEEEEED